MSRRILWLTSHASILLLSACLTMPSGPQVLAFPGGGKTLEQFKSDDALCQKDVSERINGKTHDQSAPLENAEETAPGDLSTSGLQRRYDAAYVQCMYSKGHRVPLLDRKHL